MTIPTLLPFNATQFEKDLEQAIREELGPPTIAADDTETQPQPYQLPYETLPSGEKRRVPGLKRLFDPMQCPAAFLPYLAQNRSVELYTQLSEQEKRLLIANAFEIHRNEGTGAALIFLLKNALQLDFGINDKNVRDIATGQVHWSYFELTFTRPLSKVDDHDKAVCQLVRDFTPHRNRFVQINHSGAANWKWADANDANRPQGQTVYKWADANKGLRVPGQPVFTWGVITSESC